MAESFVSHGTITRYYQRCNGTLIHER